MDANTIYLVIDAGNTRVKIALYQQVNLKQQWHLSNDEFLNFEHLISELTYDHAILSSVRSEKESSWMFSQLKNGILIEDAQLPIQLNYRTPLSLGTDRIANAVAGSYLSKQNVLCIDVGTCIKFDFIDAQKIYQGGSISPGISLRYKALNDHTAALPLLHENQTDEFIGKDTKSSMRSGVLHGIQGEINYFIDTYLNNYPDLTIFVTGGDANNFDYSSKKNIFANENLTLLGLLLILKLNAK